MPFPAFAVGTVSGSAGGDYKMGGINVPVRCGGIDVAPGDSITGAEGLGEAARVIGGRIAHIRRTMRLTIAATVALAWATFHLPAGDAARIYVYAQRGTPAHSWLSISCGGATVAELKRGTYFAINVAPGRHTLFVQGGVPLSVDTQSGEDSFVRLDWNYKIDRPPIPVLARVRAAEARREMRFLRYVNSKRVHSSLVSKTDLPPVQPQLKTRNER
jgi:hypothetical protein